MSKIQVKPAQETPEKVNKVVEKKVKDPKTPKAPKVVKPKPLALLDSIGKQEKTVKVVKSKPTVKKPLDKLSAHALKHVSSWHAKAGENGPEFAKLIAKHARTLLK